MSEPERTWFYLGKRSQPRGPFATEYMIRQCLSGRLGQNSLCWSAGMDDWQPVFTVPIFVAAIEKSKQIQGKIHFYCPCGNEVYAG
ncbi:MAG: DUF4339 domain-containing protein, partial [Sedimentisphaerales bacterium]|nr:DUF4339 domain-containing protein [Sedimentisphaerales bacterium]